MRYGPKSKNPKAFALRVFVFAYAINQPSDATPLYRKKLLRNANRCGVRIGRRCRCRGKQMQADSTHRVAATDTERCLVIPCMHKCLVPNFDQKLPIDLGNLERGMYWPWGQIGNQDRSTVVEATNGLPDSPRTVRINGQSNHPRRIDA